MNQFECLAANEEKAVTTSRLNSPGSDGNSNTSNSYRCTSLWRNKIRENETPANHAEYDGGSFDASWNTTGVQEEAWETRPHPPPPLPIRRET